MPNIFIYNDFREFFNDFIAFKKYSNPFWSYGLWAKDLGLTGASTLSMIMSGKRNPSTKLCKTFSTYFKFNEEEMNYFLKLVSLQKQAKNNPELTKILLLKDQEDQLDQKEKLNQGKEKPLFFDWRAFVIRELTKLSDFKEDMAWVRKRLNNKLSEQEIKSVIEKLLNHGALIRTEEGKLTATKQVILPGEKINREDARVFHQEISELSKQSFNIELPLRALNSSTLSIKAEEIEKAKDLIRNFQIEFSSLLEEEVGDEVYQLNIQFFPLTKR